ASAIHAHNREHTSVSCPSRAGVGSGYLPSRSAIGRAGESKYVVLAVRNVTGEPITGVGINDQVALDIGFIGRGCGGDLHWRSEGFAGVGRLNEKQADTSRRTF